MNGSESSTPDRIEPSAEPQADAIERVSDPNDGSATHKTPAHPSLGRPGVILTWMVMTTFTSSAAILTRFCDVPAASIGFFRTFGAAIVLLPFFWVIYRRVKPAQLFSRGAVVTGALLGIHFSTWAWALWHSHVANAALFISLQPAVTPLLGHWVNRERLSRHEYIGTAIAVLGMLWVLGGQLMIQSDQLAGSLMALFSMLACTGYLVLGRRYRSTQHISLFSVPVYFAAAATQAVIAFAMSGGIHLPKSSGSAWALVGLIFLPTVGGHTLLMFLLRHTKAHSIALSVPVQFVVVATAAMVLFGERPNTWFYVGAAITLAGVTLAILSSTRRPPPVAREIPNPG